MANKDDAVKKLYVGNLAKIATEEDLVTLFGLKKLSNCSLELKKGNPQNFAFINAPEHICKDILKLDKIEFYDKMISIEWSKVAGAGVKSVNRRGRGGFRRGRGVRYPWRTNEPRPSKYDVPTIPANEMFEIFDCGANLTNPKFHDYIDKVFNRAQAVGVTKFVITGMTLNGSKNALLKALSTVGAYASVGVHPHKANKEWNQAATDKLVEMVKEKKAVAIGECGLDYHRKYSSIKEMKDCFEAQCKVAADHSKAILVHERDAHNDVLEILNKFNFKAPVVMYCCTATEEQVKKYISNGYYVGITGHICKETHGKEMREMIKNKVIPLNRMMLHSDAPYMVPNIADADDISKSLLSFCGDRTNESCTLPIVVRQIATLLSAAPKDVALQLNKNARIIFRF